MGQDFSICSKETLMASLDKNSKMSFIKRMGARAELQYKLFSARGNLRFVLEGITYSDYKNLMHFASEQANCTPNPDFKIPWREVLQELQSMNGEFAPPNDGSVPILFPNPQAEAARVVMNNSGEQNFRGLINQSGYVSGNANGSIISFLDCIFSHK